jgi:hypothetical protein
VIVRSSLVVVAVLVVLLFPEEGPALRCGNLLVSEGDIRSEVFAKCGEPTDRTLYYEERKTGRITTVIPIEVWIYNFGVQNFVYFLTFENGRLIDIRTGGYGY